MEPKILLVDDDRALLEMLCSIFRRAGYADLVTASSGPEALQVWREQQPALIVLDVMMPGMDGFEVLREIRRTSHVPVLMLTARGEAEDRIEGLNAGADYYLTKPFDARELLACVGALLRRQGAEVNALSFGNTTLDLASGTLICGQRQLRLSAREFDVMRYLLQTKGQNVSKEAILSKVWGFDSNAVENHVEVYVGFLRKKLAAIGSNVRIEAVRRLGYHLEVGEVC